MHIFSSTSSGPAQTSETTILNWNSFSFITNEAVRILQPSVYPIALNRLIGMDQSVLLGQLSSDSQFFLIDPFEHRLRKRTHANSSELLATTLQIRTDDLKALVNGSTVHVSEHGYVTLMAAGVSTEGVIIANVAAVQSESEQKVSLDLMSDGLIRYAISQKTLSQLTGVNDKALANVASKKGLRSAGEAQVLLSARSAGDILSAVVNTGGVSRAHRLVNRGGVVRLESEDPDLMQPVGTIYAASTAHPPEDRQTLHAKASNRLNSDRESQSGPSRNDGTSQPNSRPKTAASQKDKSEKSLLAKSPSKATEQKSANVAPVHSKTKMAASNSRLETKSERKGTARQNKQQPPAPTSAVWRQPKWNFQADWGDGSSASQSAQ